MKIQFINILCSKWFDKVNSNTYFSCKVTIIFDDNSTKNYIIPFVYGYGEQYLSLTLDLLIKEDLINNVEKNNGISPSLYKVLEDNNINWNYNEYHCKKKDMIK